MTGDAYGGFSSTVREKQIGNKRASGEFPDGGGGGGWGMTTIQRR
jgi:hypothetical protein